MKANILCLGQHFASFLFSGDVSLMEQMLEGRENAGFTVSSLSVRAFTQHSSAVSFQMKRVLVLL